MAVLSLVPSRAQALSSSSVLFLGVLQNGVDEVRIGLPFFGVEGEPISPQLPHTLVLEWAGPNWSGPAHSVADIKNKNHI